MNISYINEGFSTNVKALEGFVEEYRKGNSKGFIAFRVDKDGEHCHPIVAWDKGAGTSMIGALELVKSLAIKIIEN